MRRPPVIFLLLGIFPSVGGPVISATWPPSWRMAAAHRTRHGHAIEDDHVVPQGANAAIGLGA